MREKFLAGILAACMVSGHVTGFAMGNKAVISQGELKIGMEQLNRGLVAMQSENGIYLSWRLLATDTYDGIFEVYRNGEMINTVADSTNYFDSAGSKQDIYQVRAVVNNEKLEMSEQVSAFESGSNFFDILLEVPEPVSVPYHFDATDDTPAYWGEETATYQPGDASCGDVDGDGEYELILKWDPSNAKDSSFVGYSGNVYIDAYKLSGQRLWRIDLGKNVRAGAHYTQFSVYDLDGDGKAEVCMQTAPGSKDSAGAYVSTVSTDPAVQSAENTKDYRNSGGWVHGGKDRYGNLVLDKDGNPVSECPIYYTVFSGETGEALDTVMHPAQTESVFMWGDRDGNRADRYLGAVAYLDGVNPYVVSWRGYYPNRPELSGRQGQTSVNAFRFENGRLTLTHSFDTWSEKAGYTAGNENYIGQGNHNLTVADVDGDGCDEIISGALCLDNDFSVKWCSYMGHGDALHLQNYDPTRPGFEYFSVHESQTTNSDTGHVQKFGMSVHDAATGELISSTDGSKDTARGVMANVGAGGYYQAWGAGTVNSDGESISLSGQSYNFRIYWDGDFYDELLDGSTRENSDGSITMGIPSITKYNKSTRRFDTLFTSNEIYPINGTKNTPVLQADLFGDWREEIIYPLNGGTTLRVFTTNIPTTHKLTTLMHDKTYRLAVAWQNTAYNQPPHVGFYIGEEVNDGTDTMSRNPLVLNNTAPPVGYLGYTAKTAVETENGYIGVKDGTMGFNITPSTDVAKISFDVNFKSGTQVLDFKNTSSSEIDKWEHYVVNFAATGRNIVFYPGGKSTTLIRNYKKDKWYKFEITADSTNRTGTIEIFDGDTNASLAKNTYTYRSKEAVNFSRFMVTSNDGEVQFKNFTITEGETVLFDSAPFLEPYEPVVPDESQIPPIWYMTQIFRTDDTLTGVSIARIKENQEEQDETLLAAAYDEDGNMTEMQIVDVSNLVTNVSNNCKLDLDILNASVVKIFIWNADTMKAYTQAIKL